MVPSQPRLQCETLRTEDFRGSGKGYAGPETESGPQKQGAAWRVGRPHCRLASTFGRRSLGTLGLPTVFSSVGGSSHGSSRKCRDSTPGS